MKANFGLRPKKTRQAPALPPIFGLHSHDMSLFAVSLVGGHHEKAAARTEDDIIRSRSNSGAPEHRDRERPEPGVTFVD